MNKLIFIRKQKRKNKGKKGRKKTLIGEALRMGSEKPFLF